MVSNVVKFLGPKKLILMQVEKIFSKIVRWPNFRLSTYSADHTTKTLKYNFKIFRA